MRVVADQNRNARIRTSGSDRSDRLSVSTAGRDPGTLEARADVRERDDVLTGRSLAGLSIRTAGGRNIRLSGQEARTLYRVLNLAVNGG